MPSSHVSVIPKNYDELERQYGRLIYSVLLKANKIERNFEDLHSYIWMKLIEARLLLRFEAKIQRQTPKVLSATQACDFLGVSWQQWESAMWSYHKGQPRKRKDGTRKPGPRKRGHWMPTPINLMEFQVQGLFGYNAKTALVAFEDVIRLTLEEKTFRKMGRDVQDGVVVGESRPEGYLKFPEVKPTKAQFQNYLVMAVLNHYANFCRTQERRHKERPYTPPAYKRNEEAPAWESTLPDKSANADTMIALDEARQMLSNTLHEHMVGLEGCKPVKETESKVFTSLENGASLMQALRNTELPPKVCKSVIDTVRPLAREFS